MFNRLSVILCLSACFLLNASLAALQSEIIEYESKRDVNQYYFKFITSDAQEREESGQLITNGDKQIWVVRGYYSYSIAGTTYKVTYQAGESGYTAKVKLSLRPLNIVPARQPLRVRINSALLASLSGGGIG